MAGCGGRRKGDERGVPMPRGDGLYGEAEAEADCGEKGEPSASIVASDIVGKKT